MTRRAENMGGWTDRYPHAYNKRPSFDALKLPSHAPDKPDVPVWLSDAARLAAQGHLDDIIIVREQTAELTGVRRRTMGKKIEDFSEDVSIVGLSLISRETDVASSVAKPNPADVARATLEEIGYAPNMPYTSSHMLKQVVDLAIQNMIEAYEIQIPETEGEE